MVVGGPEIRQQAAQGAVHERSDKPTRIDHLLAFLLAGSVFVVHDVGYMLSHPFWIDESWVADSTRAPIGLVPWLTSSTPLGWTLMLRVIPSGGGQDLRVLPLAFTALAVLLGYYFGRELPLPRYVGGLLTGSAVLLVPAMLVRDDLKQYTAEACASIAILLLLARIEKRWTRGRLAGIAILTAGGLLFANSVVFVGVAAMIALVISTLIHREYRRSREAAIGLAGTVAFSGVLYELIDAPHVIPIDTLFWSYYYVPRNHGFSGAWSFLHGVAVGLAPYLGSRFIALDVGLALLGIAGLIRFKRYALAAVVLITIVLVIAASADRRYPFGDLRTSTFWLVMVALLMAIGIGSAISVFAGGNSVLALVAVALTIAIYVISVNPYIRSHPIPNEDVRSQVSYVNSHRRPGDIVIVNSAAGWGFAYYERELIPSFEHVNFAATGFFPTFPGVHWLILMQNGDVQAALRSAVERIKGQTNSGSDRIWIIRSHDLDSGAWQQALSGEQVTVIPVGPEPLLLYRPFRHTHRLATTSVLLPSHGATLSGSTTLDASASKATSVEFRLFGGSYGYSGKMLCTATPTIYGWLCSWNTSTVPNGSHVLVSEAFNSAGSTFSSGVSVTVSNPPTTSVLIPSHGATLSGSTTLDASASKATSVDFWILGGSYGYSGKMLCTATLAYYGWVCSWNSKTVPDGSYSLVSEAFNSGGSAFSSGVSITVHN